MFIIVLFIEGGLLVGVVYPEPGASDPPPPPPPQATIINNDAKTKVKFFILISSYFIHISV